MLKFSGKNIVVTGAAGNLGGAVVKAFLNAGGSVIALDHRTGRLAEMFQTGGQAGEIFVFEGVDLMDRQSVIGLAERVRDAAGLVDVIVHTVGGFAAGDPVHELLPETLQKMMDLNVSTFLNAAAGFVPHMLQKGGGKVVTIGARAGLAGPAKTGAYAAAKSSLLRLTESMAAELKPVGIQVNCVLPSTIDTPENRQEMPKADFSKWVKPEKLAAAVLFLASPEADAISGAALPVYG